MLTAWGGAEARCIAHWLHHGLPAAPSQLTVAADELCHALSMLFSSTVWSACPALKALAADWRSVSMAALDAATPPLPGGLTPEQEAVVSWARQLGQRVEGVPGRSAKVLAFACTGKSAALGAIAGALQPGMRVVYLTYNRSMAEAAEHWPEFIEARGNGVVVDTSTVHALAFAHVIEGSAAMQQKFDRARDGLSDRDVCNILRDEGWNRSLAVMSGAWQACQNFHRSGDDELGAQHIQSGLPQVPALAAALLARMENPGDSFPITYDGYVSVYARSQPLAWDEYDVMLVDEVQDVSAVALRVLERARLERGCAVIYTGDSHQHLYAFAGARNGLAELATDATFRLTRTFRFGANLAVAADKLLAIKGETVPLRGARGVETRVVCAAGDPLDLDRRDHAVLVRMNATWFRLAIQAMDAGQHVYVEDAEKTLLALERLALQNPNAQAAAEAEDEGAAVSLRRLVEVLGPARVLSDINRLRTQCVPKADATVQFSTVQQAKGLQSDSCELAADVWHCRQRELQDDGNRHDGLHIAYTSLTRAKRNVALPGWFMNALDDFPRLVTNGLCGECGNAFAVGLTMPAMWCRAAFGNPERMFCAACARLQDDELHVLPLAALAERLGGLQVQPVAAGAAP